MGKLYERLGFVPSGETEFHYQMMKPKQVIIGKWNVEIWQTNVNMIWLYCVEGEKYPKLLFEWVRYSVN